MKGISDKCLRELILKTAAGDKGAFTELYQKTSKVFYSAARMHFKNIFDVEDVLQDAYMKIFNAAGTYNSKEGISVSAWMFKILRNTMTDAKRERLKAKYAELTEDIPADSGNADARLEAYLLLRRLPQTDKDILYAKIWFRMPFKEIGEALNLPAATVQYRFNRLKKELKRPPVPAKMAENGKN